MLKFLSLLLALTWALPSQAALKFDWHSDSITQATYAAGWRDATNVYDASGPQLTTTGISGVFGGKYLDMSSTVNGGNFLQFSGGDNCPLSTTGFTFLIRVIPVASGAPAATQGLFNWGGMKDSNQGALGGAAFNINTLGKLCVTAGKANSTGLGYFNNACFATALTFVANQPTDIWFTWDGLSTANHAKLYQAQAGGAPSLVSTMTASAAQTASPRASCGNMITLDNTQLIQNKNGFHLNEIAIWDDAEDPIGTYGTRSTFITSTVYEGYNHTALTTAQVQSGVQFGAGPNSQTGTGVMAAAATTKTGVAANDGTGSYDGSDRWTCPIAGDILDSAAAIKCNSTSTNRTGTYHAAASTDVKHGVAFGVSSGSTGSYFGADWCTDPGRDNVRSTATYLAAGVSTTGNYFVASAFDVKFGQTYGVSGTGSTGRLTCTQLPTSVVSNGTAYTNYAGDFVGTFLPACVSVPPPAADVRTGTIYTVDGIGYLGSLQLPPVDKVKLGYAYEDGSTLGTLECTSPGDGNVANGITWKTYSTTHTGTLQAVTNYLTAATLKAGSTAPSVTKLAISQGDDVILTLWAQDSSGAAFDLTGATFSSQVLGEYGKINSFGNAKHAADPDQVTNKGKFTLTLSAADTAKLYAGPGRELVVKVTQGSASTYFHAPELLTVLAARPVR